MYLSKMDEKVKTDVPMLGWKPRPLIGGEEKKFKEKKIKDHHPDRNALPLTRKGES